MHCVAFHLYLHAKVACVFRIDKKLDLEWRSIGFELHQGKLLILN